jgi:type II secretion system protein L
MLRIFVAGAPRADRPDPWVRHAGDGRPIAQGRDVPARRPGDADVEVVLAAGAVRLFALALPAMPRNRLRSAARFAIEDQLATAVEDSAIALSSARDGGVVAAVASQALVGAIVAQDRRVRRIVPEAALAPLGSGWTWCASGDGDTFVRRADGSAFAVGGASEAAPDVPGALAAALAQAARSGAPPPAVHVAFACDAARLAHWTQASGVPFVAAPAWRWQDAAPQAFAAAPDFLEAGERDVRPTTPVIDRRAWRPALVLAGAALVVHVVALASQWSWLHFENGRLGRALVDEAVRAGVTDATTPAAAAGAILRRNTDARHRAGQSAAADALPLLARAAPSLSTLPAGTLRSANYAGGAWTLELGKLDKATLERFTRSLAAAGVDALAASTSAGARVRVALAASAR